ncbi:hypothetical protein LOZ65_006454 [Ophidiomyces ophidiicola]|nr:hypothetical protein LOZ65_006454 [Ophidiomyces ophidiicola]
MEQQRELLRDIGLMRHPLPDDLTDRANIEHVLDHGYVMIQDCFTKQEAEAAKSEIDRLTGSSPLHGRNAFEGFNTNRIYSLLNKTREFDKFTTLPRVLALNDYFLEHGYNISSFHTIQINPGEKNQDMHHDDAFCHVPLMKAYTLIILMYTAFDDFTLDNGATGIIPGSHVWGSDRRGEYEETVPMICPTGSVGYFLGTTWHCGGANRSQSPRKSATVQYCQPYIRPIENQILAVDPRKLRDIPPRIVEMMGYRVHQPFIGYADGLNPIKAMQRMVNWLQGPVDHSPPAFASSTQGESKL